MDYDGFLGEWEGKQVTDYGGECVALVAQYCAENGKPIAYANAKDWFNHPALADAFDSIPNDPNDPSQVPARGNPIIWSGDLPGSGGYGHIAIFDEVLPDHQFQSFDQNWGGSSAHFQTHTWAYALGWLAPKALPVIPPHPDPAPANPSPDLNPDINPPPVPTGLPQSPTPPVDPPPPVPTPVEPTPEPAGQGTTTTPVQSSHSPGSASGSWFSQFLALLKLIFIGRK